MEVKEEFPRHTKDQYRNKKLGKMSNRKKEEHGKNCEGRQIDGEARLIIQSREAGREKKKRPHLNSALHATGDNYQS